MRIDIYHASKFGNGATVAEELKRLLESHGSEVVVHHIGDVKPKEVALADLYIFGSPTRMGQPIGSMRRFLKKAALPQGAKYAVFATHTDEVPDKKTGKMPTPAELDAKRKNIPTLDAILKEKGLVKVADQVFNVVMPSSKESSMREAMAGHLRDDWQKKAEEFAVAILGAA